MKTRHMTIIGILAALVLAPLAAGQDSRPGRRQSDAFDGPGQGGRQQWRQQQDRGQRHQYDRPQRGGGFGPGAMQQQDRRGGPDAGPMGRVDIGQRIAMMTRVADLTPEQKTAVEAIAQTHRRDARDHHQALQDANRQLRQAVAAGDIEQVEQKATAVGEAITRQAVAEAATLNAVRAELTEEQLEKLDQMRQRMQERAEQFRQDRRHDRQGPFEPGQGRRFNPRRPQEETDQDAQ